MPKGYELKGLQGQKTLVLGGLGFIGSNTAHKLVELGAEVTIFDGMLPGLGANKANIKEIESQVSVITKDMRDLPALCEAVKDKSMIFNCAGQSSHVESMDFPLEDLQVNLVANLNLLEACKKHNEDAKIVFAGTRAEIGKPAKLPVTEETTPHPLDIYSVNKWAAGQYHLLYSNYHGLHACNIRVSNCYGPRSQMQHPKYGIMNWFIRLALENKKIQVFGDGKQIRDYNYVDDAVDSMILAAQNKKSDGKIYCIGSGEKTMFVDYVKKIVEIAGTGSFEPVEWPGKRKSIDIGDFYSDFKLIKEELGWTPSTPLDQGLKKTIDFYKQRLQEYI